MSIGRRLIKTKRVRSAPNLTRARNSKVTPTSYVNDCRRVAKEISELTSCGVSLNEVREQLEDLNSARYDAEKGQGRRMDCQKISKLQLQNCDFFHSLQNSGF